MVTVKVYSKSSGNPIKGAKVSLMFSGLISGGSVPGQYTNNNGEVHFNIGTGNGTIYVNGRDAKTGYISGMEVVYV